MAVCTCQRSLTLNHNKCALPCVDPPTQERFQVKSPPSIYLTKIKGFYQDQGGVPRKVGKHTHAHMHTASDARIHTHAPVNLINVLLPVFYGQLSIQHNSLKIPIFLFCHFQSKKSIQEATKVLKDLEISLRTNHIG